MKYCTVIEEWSIFISVSLITLLNECYTKSFIYNVLRIIYIVNLYYQFEISAVVIYTTNNIIYMHIFQCNTAAILAFLREIYSLTSLFYFLLNC